jgi:hypothetical protein
MRVIIFPAFTASSRQRSRSSNSAFSSGTSFFSGWRATPDQPARLAHLDHCNQCLVLAERN